MVIEIHLRFGLSLITKLVYYMGPAVLRICQRPKQNESLDKWSLQLYLTVQNQ